MQLFVFERRFRLKIRQKIQRAIFTIAVKTVFRSGQKAEQIRFIKTVQIENEIEFAAANFPDELENFLD